MRSLKEEVMEKKQEKNLTVFCHIGGIIPLYFLNLIVPLIIWLTKKDQSPFIKEQGREIVNFQISLSIYGVALLVLGLTGVGLAIAVPGGLILAIINIVSIIRGAIKASSGEKFLYPINLRLIK